MTLTMTAPLPMGAAAEEGAERITVTGDAPHWQRAGLVGTCLSTLLGCAMMTWVAMELMSRWYERALTDEPA